MLVYITSLHIWKDPTKNLVVQKVILVQNEGYNVKMRKMKKLAFVQSPYVTVVV